MSVNDISSGAGNTDQLSVKDSGKGDSDFNDSDSDISGDGGKKNFLTFQPRQREFPAHFLVLCHLRIRKEAQLIFCLISSPSGASVGDNHGTYCAAPPQSFRTPRDNSYTLGFSPAPIFTNPHGYGHSWMVSGYGTNCPKSRGSMQSFSRAGTLPPYFPQQQRGAAAAAAVAAAEAAEVQNQSPNFVTVATSLEVATIF